MSKSGKKGNKPQQNSKKIEEKIDKDLEEKVDEAVDTDVSEDIEPEVTYELDIEVDEAETESEAEVNDDAEDEEPEVPEEEEESEPAGEKASEVKKDKTLDADDKFRALPFTEKCKRDPVIPVSILLAFVAVIVGVVYFILPVITTPSMGITLEDFRAAFDNSEIAQYQIYNGHDIGFRTPPYVNPNEKPSLLGDKSTISVSAMYADFFDGPMSFVNGAGIEGAARKSDGKLSYARVYVQYDPKNDPDSIRFSTVWILFANTLETLYPELDFYSAMNLAADKFGEASTSDLRFYVKGDYAFRLVCLIANDGQKYVVIDVVPRSTVKKDMIREDLDVTMPAATTAISETSAASETAPAST